MYDRKSGVTQSLNIYPKPWN